MNMKNINRFVLIALLCAPIVYLFGSLFTALTGDKQEFPLSASYELATSSRVVTMNQSVRNGNFENSSYWESRNSTFTVSNNTLRFTATAQYGRVQQTSLYPVRTHKYMLSYSYYSTDRNNLFAVLTQSSNLTLTSSGVVNAWTDQSNFFTWSQGSGVASLYFADSSSSDFALISIRNVCLFDLTSIFGEGNEPSTKADFVKYFPDAFYSYDVSTKYYIETLGVPDNSQYLFNQFFAKDNFLSQMGKEALSDSEQGFYPANALLRVLDENVLHYGSDNNTACMGYGYFAWVFNVVLLDMVVYLSMKLLLLPLKAVDVFERGNDL